MGGTSNARKQRMQALAKARAVATAKRKEAKRLGIPLSEVQLPPSAAELELIAAQEKEKQVRNYLKKACATDHREGARCARSPPR